MNIKNIDIIQTNKNENASHNSPEPHFKYFDFIIKTTDTRNTKSQKVCNNNNRKPRCNGKYEREEQALWTVY